MKGEDQRLNPLVIYVLYFLVDAAIIITIPDGEKETCLQACTLTG